jgi:hypothetical protein
LDPNPHPLDNWISTTIQILQEEVEVLALSMTIHRFFSRSGSIGPLNDNTQSLQQEVDVLAFYFFLLKNAIE